MTCVDWSSHLRTPFQDIGDIRKGMLAYGVESPGSTVAESTLGTIYPSFLQAYRGRKACTRVYTAGR